MNLLSLYLVIRHTRFHREASYVIRHWSFVIGHSSLVICHWSFVIGHLSLVEEFWHSVGAGLVISG
ncbi:MAG: hypothetical protein RIB93_13840 [Coleofasciculus sp. D1-CHI-01]|uniref:hypothetical protein n=1 Tax=Coleofasciculus sp. D1-CHI-01 TaxID=3068482 RepID=UPI0032FCB214